MVTVPAFLLRRLYVKGSLRNAPDGFEFQLLNRLGSGYAHKMLPLSVDNLALPLSATTFDLDGQTTGFHEVSQDRTFTLAMNKRITIRIAGAPLEPGPHKIGMGFDVPGLGTLSFDFTDTIADDLP